MRLENNNLNFYTVPVLVSPDPLNGIRYLDPVYTLDIQNVQIVDNPSYFTKVYDTSVSAWCISANNPGSVKYCNFYYDVSSLENTALSLYSTYKILSGSKPLTINNIYYTTSGTYHGSINSSAADFATYYNNQTVTITSGTQYAYIQLALTSGAALIKDIHLKLYTPKNNFIADTTITNPINFLNKQFKGGNVANTLGLSGFDVNKSQYVSLKNNYGLNTIRWEVFKHTPDNPSWDFYDWNQAQVWLSSKIIQLKKALDYCGQNSIKVIVDMHNRFGLDTNNGSGKFLFDADIREKNFEMWRQVVTAIKGHPAILAYGVINEPSNNVNTPGIPAEYVENRYTMSPLEYQELAIHEILKIDPTAKFSVTSTKLSKPEGYTTMKPLKWNCIYETHVYFTGEYTSQAYPTSSVQYPGYYDASYKTIVDKEAIRKYLQPVRDFQLAYNVPIYVGEFGSVRWAPTPQTWIMDCMSIFDEYGWNYTAFELFGYYHAWNPQYDPAVDPSNMYAPTASVRPTPMELAYIQKLSACSNLFTVAEMTPTIPTNLSITSNATSKLRINWDEVAVPLSVYSVNYIVNQISTSSLSTSANSALISGTVGNNVSVTISYSNLYGSATSNSVSATVNKIYPCDKISATPFRAYSVRQLTSGYNGPLIRVVRSDASERDISAAENGILDISALSTFISAGTSGTVRTWYDQSGNGLHLSQSNAARRSLIASNGTVLMNGSIPAIEFNGSRYYSDTSASIYLTSSTTFASIRSLSGLSQQDPIWSEIASAGSQVFQTMVVANNTTGLKSHIVADDGSVLITNTSTSGSPAFNGQTNILTVVDYYDRIEHRVNSNEDTKTVQQYAIPRSAHPITLSANSYFNIGGRYRGGSVTGMIESMISEVVIYKQALSNDQIRIIETNLLDAYN